MERTWGQILLWLHLRLRCRLAKVLDGAVLSLTVLSLSAIKAFTRFGPEYLRLRIVCGLVFSDAS